MTLFPQSPAPPGCSATVTLIPFPEAGHLDSSWFLPFPNPHPRPLHTRWVLQSGGDHRRSCPKGVPRASDIWLVGTW